MKNIATEVIPMNFMFAQELPPVFELERKPMIGDTTTWNPSIPQFTSDD